MTTRIRKKAESAKNGAQAASSLPLHIQVRETIRQYQRLMAGEIAGETLWRELKLTHQLGVTRGAMERAER